MRFSIAAAALSAATIVSASKPFTGFPLSNGFPSTPSNADLAKIEENAGGSLPNGALPKTLTPTAVSTFQLVALQEIFETAYFTDLLKNITNKVPGYETPNSKYMMRVFRRIRAQEELHALGANGILEGAGEKTVGGCKYTFPVTDLMSAITLANIFTDVVLGVIPAVQALVASDGGDEAALVPLLGSILAQEGEQTGFFRYYQGKVPSAAPFLTGGAGQFAFSALKMFIVPGSCPYLPDIPTFTPITVTTPPTSSSYMATYTVDGTVTMGEDSVVYLSGQTLPVTVPITKATTSGGVTTFTASFPFDKGFAKGLSIAAVVKGDKTYMSAADVAADTMYGPGLIEFD